jgi:hypothetical protein
VEKIVKREVEPLINKLMTYFDGEVNYTLAGYVSKILSLFFTKKPADVIELLFSSSDTSSRKISWRRFSIMLNLDQSES